MESAVGLDLTPDSEIRNVQIFRSLRAWTFLLGNQFLAGVLARGSIDVDLLLWAEDEFCHCRFGQFITEFESCRQFYTLELSWPMLLGLEILYGA